VLERLHAGTIHDDAERLEAWGEPAADLLDRTERAIGRGHREQAGLRHDRHAVAGGPRRAGEGVQRRGAVDQHELVVGLHVREGLLELPDLADRRMGAVEVDRGRAPDHHIDGRLGIRSRPAARGDRRTDDLLLRRGEHIGDVQVAGHLDVHAGRDVGLRVEVDDEGPDAAREGRRRQSEGDGRLADTALQRTDAEYVHEQIRYLYYSGDT
jgi:hypothetical protein